MRKCRFIPVTGPERFPILGHRKRAPICWNGRIFYGLAVRTSPNNAQGLRAAFARIALVAMLVRALIPAGWMPAPEGGVLTPCWQLRAADRQDAGAVPDRVIEPASDHAHNHSSGHQASVGSGEGSGSADQEQLPAGGFEACDFGSLVHAVALDGAGAPALPVVLANAHSVPLANQTMLTAANAAIPWPRGPPHLV